MIYNCVGKTGRQAPLSKVSTLGLLWKLQLNGVVSLALSVTLPIICSLLPSLCVLMNQVLLHWLSLDLP